MFRRPEKKTPSSKVKPLSTLTAISPCSTILAEEKRPELLAQIKEAIHLEPSRFDGLCLSLINNLVNHCQFLPETANSYYSQPGGLLDNALNRTEAALSLFKQYSITETQGELSEDQKLWQYALFSATLLQGIGKLYVEFSVDLYDDNGQFLKQWNPLLDNLVSIGSHYYFYEFLTNIDLDVKRRLNLLVARLLMPANGFSWISSNPNVLAVWLALVYGDLHGAGTLGAILIRANAIAIQRFFNQFMIKTYGTRGGRYGRVSTFSGGIPESIADLEQYIGIAFIQWLSKSLESGQITLNKPPLLGVPGGLLLSHEAFKMFIREHPEFKNWQAAQKGFLSLGLHRLNPDGDVMSRFERTDSHEIHNGIVFSDYAVALPEKASLYHSHMDKTSILSATEIIHHIQNSHHFMEKQAVPNIQMLLHLNVTGQWQPVKTPQMETHLKPGAIKSD